MSADLAGRVGTARSTKARERRCWLVVVAFAISMAWTEAATVYYLRVMTDRVVPYQLDPLPIRGVLGAVELVREAATLLMLLTVGMLAGRTWRTRFGYSAIAFGVWDIFYYVCLLIICDWPTSLLEWDILFLLPLPWWGPVLAPVCIAILMIGYGTLVTQSGERREVPLTTTTWAQSALGIMLALYVFMADSIHTVQQGLDATRQMLPTAFNWPVFVMALVLMAAPVAQLAWRWARRWPIRIALQSKCLDRS